MKKRRSGEGSKRKANKDREGEKVETAGEEKRKEEGERSWINFDEKRMKE